MRLTIPWTRGVSKRIRRTKQQSVTWAYVLLERIDRVIFNDELGGFCAGILFEY
jgi:hypothetical protein